MGIDRELTGKAEGFLKQLFFGSAYLAGRPSERDYRLEHSFRVANIAVQIADKEGMDLTFAAIAGLLHDIAYAEPMPTERERRGHGRRSAQLARPFLEGLGLGQKAVGDICYGIAIHVDDEADFEWQRTPFSETVSDADNIDRFGAYRIYETLQYQKFSELGLAQKQQKVSEMLQRLGRLGGMELGTPTATLLWRERLGYYTGFYQKLQTQLSLSTEVL